MSCFAPSAVANEHRSRVSGWMALPLTRAIRWLLLGVFAATTMAASPPAAAEQLADVPFGVATDGLFDEARNDGRQGEPGRWDLVQGRLHADALELRFRIQPPRVGLSVQPGPAVLFGALHLFGDAGGDMATGQWVKSFVAVTLPPCADDACVYTADIALPVNDLAPAITRLETHGSLMWASAEMTLVRTFGGGSWLQALPFMFGGAGGLGADAGRLGAIVPTKGTMFPFGLFPSEQATRIPADPDLLPAGFDYRAAVEQRRRDAGDSSLSLPTAPGHLHVAINPTCEGSSVLTLHDEAGDRIFDAPLMGVPSIDERLPIPLGVPLWLTLHDGGGIDFDQGRQGWGVRLGPVGTTEAPIAVDASLDCRVPRGTVRVTEAVVAPTASAATAAIEGTPAGDVPGPAVVLIGAFAAIVVVLSVFSRARKRS